MTEPNHDPRNNEQQAPPEFDIVVRIPPRLCKSLNFGNEQTPGWVTIRSSNAVSFVLEQLHHAAVLKFGGKRAAAMEDDPDKRKNLLRRCNADSRGLVAVAMLTICKLREDREGIEKLFGTDAANLFGPESE